LVAHAIFEKINQIAKVKDANDKAVQPPTSEAKEGKPEAESSDS